MFNFGDSPRQAKRQGQGQASQHQFEGNADWAQQIPPPDQWRFRSAYEDYGWERGQSVLPEFRDPSLHEHGQGQGQPSWATRGPQTGRGPKNYQRSDERILEDVCERLTQHGQVDASEIEVRVENGAVTLSGTVDSRQAKHMAEDAADSVSGVRDVHNQLRVQSR
ncbi:MAG: BON domain-containing protein [Anaerolineae bacterium]|nr:BON domain-containing protein [Anaerolineae bacterium]